MAVARTGNIGPARRALAHEARRSPPHRNGKGLPRLAALGIEYANCRGRPLRRQMRRTDRARAKLPPQLGGSLSAPRATANIPSNRPERLTEANQNGGPQRIDPATLEPLQVACHCRSVAPIIVSAIFVNDGRRIVFSGRHIIQTGDVHADKVAAHAGFT